ncbi:hypothetical protein BJ878DRAFT_494386 [Calycina marina]|uniref:UBL3-like ubiquitin domain-containing protein n=1 Tax=Calycina marina TaxID=1763456 RepID=A0A9P7Z8Z4_9HELO|nr:hypothetical protein BJ878DRAFT_494386 [Calycina marina]
MASSLDHAAAIPPSSSGPEESTSTSQHNIEMENLKTKTPGTQCLLNDVSTLETSPISSGFPAAETGSKHAASSKETGEHAPEQIDPLLAEEDDEIVATPISANPESGPALVIALLLPGTGARHPYKIDEKYLTKRNVAVPDMTEDGKKDPMSISIYTLKELILREWRDEWETAPSSPSSIRLITFGRLLDDKTALRDCRFSAQGPNVVHMTVKPQDIVEEEETRNKVPSRNGDREGQGGCRCSVM